MNVEILNILKEAHAKGVKLGINGDSLTIKSVDSIDSDLLQKIKDNKIYILEYIQKLKIKNKKNVLPKVTPGNGDSLERIPLSFGQERLWFLDQLQGSIEYHMPVVLKLSGILNFSYLESSLSCIIDRHEVLRTNIVSQNGIGHQELVSSNNWILENKILNTNDNLEEMISSFLELPFDLSKDYKLRACLYELGNQEYVLACVFHHIASDGWSEGIFSYELKELYCSFQNNRKVVLPELALQYRDYAIWQRNYLAGSVLESQLSYWEAKLKGATTLILPYDNPRPSVQSTAGASVSIVLDKKLTVALESLCQEEGVTFFMMMLSAFKVLLSKYSGQDDICVGTPIANRTQVELEGMIGFFLNTLALRSDLSGNPTFKELLLRVKETTLEGYDHQLTPFEKVVDRVVRNRDMSMSPLFQVLFVLQNTPESSKETPTELEGITITGYKFDSVTSKFDLMLTISEDSLGLVLNLEYSTVLFDKPTIERMLGHYEQLLACIAADASQPIGSLSMLSAHEEHQLLDVFNATGVDYPLDRTVVDLFEEQVVKSPDAIAVVFEGEQLSYRELDERSNQLAHYLCGRGVVADTLVGICLERSVEMLVGILGILKSSGAYVPIDPEYPVERIGYMLEDAAIQLVLSSSASHAALKEHPVSVLLLDDQWDLICGHPSGKPDTVLLPHNLAYVIYTSGSTGNPKGVMIEHTNVVRLFKNESCLYDFESSDVWTLFHSFCFDFSVWEMYGALLFGGRLVIVPKAATKDSIAFKELLVKEGVTVLNQTPGSFYAFQEEFLHGSFEHSLRYVIFGGEALNPSYLRNWKQTYPDCALINMYGITETTVHVTYKEITEIEVLNSVSNIGSAIPTLGCYIVDSDLNLVPVGVVGELCVGGAGVARGYLNREALTEEKFVKNPFEESNFKLYRSGDLARWLPDGNLEYIGRSDAQVKIRGYRIELGEIENALSLMDQVKQCCVVAKHDAGGTKRLVGYVVLEGPLNKESLQDGLRSSLPDYMVPLLWVELDSMPLTSNGKLDRKGLPDPDSSELSSREYVSPGNETEEKLAIIWQDLLGLDQVGIYDNFFEIGGDSIISIRLISKINETFHQRIQLKDLFKYGNIHSFSASVLDKSGYDPKLEQSYEKVESDISTLRLSVMNSLTDLDSLEDVYPMTDVQQGMIMESLLKPGLAVFHDQMVFPFKDQFFDNVVFHKAITLLIEKHSIFRTRFNISDYDQPVQIVYRTVSFDIGQTDLSLFSKEVQKKRIEEFLASEREIPFKVEEGSLYRFNIFNIDSFNKIFVYQFHHAIMDGWSVASFVTELHKTYFELKKQNDYLPSVITCSQRDFVIKELVAKQDVDAIDFWKRELSSYKYLDVFLEETEVSYYYSKKYDLSFLGNLRKQCKEYNITLKTVFFGAYIYALHMLTREDELTIGLVSNNRPLIKDGDKVLGCFLNTLPVRYIFQSDESWLSYFKSIEKKIDDVNLYGHLTFFEIKHLVGINNEDSFFDVLFNYIDFHVYDEIATENTLTNNLANENIYKENLNIASFERTSSSLNLTINLTGGAGVEFEYALHKDFKSKVSLERFQSYIDNTLHCFNEKINSTVSMNQILSKVEFNQLTKTFNDTFFSYPKHTTVVDLFSEQVRKNPQAIAVIYENKELSFQDLDKLSNQLARYLLSTYDIHSEGLIGVVLDRSDWLIVSFLAILKTGAAYVPIDINYPEKRKEYIRSDINSRIIIDDLLLNSFQANSSNFSDDLLEVTINDNDLAYVIYTSGSTGKPKGVMIEHKSIVNTILSQISSFSINNNDNCLQFASSSFDASIWEICISLFSGSCLYIIEEESKSDTGFFKNFIISNSITFATLPPAFLQLLEVEDLKGIRTLVTAGESIALRIAKTFSKHCNYINAYGPTETSICATTFNGNIGDLVPIGKPIHNTQIYILNEYHDLLPVGVIGELCIGGVGVARGYLNQESLTAEKFVNNPFRDGERLYKTGDLARWLPDGNLEYIGRSDAQVKIRGYRIELGEIENALSLMDQVKQCCVVAKHDAGGTKRLVGYVVLEGPLNKESLQDGLRSSLPDYMVPLLWVELDSMPLTSNGKLDRKGLPDPDSSELSSREYVSPGNETEEKLAIIWQDLLGLDQVGIYDNFFELGGHSLLATRLVSMIRRELKTEVSIRDVFEHTTISELGSHISVHSTGVLLPAVVPERRPLRIPLSFSQERLWFLDQLQGSTEYHIPVVLRLQGSLDVSILEQTLQRIVSRHEVLRTLLLSEEGIGYQEIIGAQDWHLDYVEMSEGSMLEQSLEGYLGSAFDLSKDYKLRACLYDLGGQQYVLACVFHHIASDGWSEGILSHEFMELYSSLQAGREAMLAELPLQYADYAIWQRKYLEGSVLEDQLSYWEAKLQGTATLSLPTDHARPSIQGSAGSSVSVFLEKSLSSSLESLCQREGVTLFMLMLSAFKVLLSRYSGQEDICVGTPIANRTQSELEGMIGFFVNTLALRSDLGGNPSFRELLARVKETTLGGYDHQLAPFEKVVDRVVTTREMSTTPLFQVMFDFHNKLEDAKSVELDLQDITITGYDHADTTSQFDLMLSISEGTSDISLAINYSTVLFDKPTIERMLGHYEQLLACIAADASQPIGSLSMLSAHEEHQLLDVFNATGVDYPLDRTVVDLFEEQVVKSPDAIAVVFEGEQLSYRELDERSNQLAHYLCGRGVVADTLVGICLERSVEMLVGILGILKSSGAYVPIKPDYPASRISYILEDTRCALLLTDQLNHEMLMPLSEGIRLVVLDGPSPVYSGCLQESLDISHSPDSLGYVIYTSGSTGRPKGALIEHAGLLNHLLVMVDDLNMDNTSVVAFTAPFTFDISVWQLLSGLLCGGRIVVYSEQMILDADDFQNALAAHGVTHLQLVPSYVLSLLETSSRKGLEDLRYFLVTGEAATPSLLRSWFSLFPDVAMVNAYGPAEASDDVSLHVMHEAPSGVVVPIGKPVANMSLYVVDGFDNLCPIGVVGELWVSGIGVGRGYLNQESLTAEKFVNNPFRDGERLYKTGDLARWLPDGNLEYIGRSDAQVKIRGYRIELGEIENALSLMDQVKQCCVVAKHDAVGTKRLVGYVVLEGPLNKESLQDGLRSSLPDYMVPLLWVELDSMPLTSNGKLDRKGLPDPDSSELSSREYVSPGNETEEKLAIIWQDLLGLDQVGIYDNFFELGGHSLLATRLVSMIRRELKTEVSIRDVFEHTTISELGSHISVHSTGVLLPAVVPERRPLRIPLSFSQERLWFLDQLQGSTEYHIPVVLRLQGSLDVSILEQTLQRIVSRHEVLRTLLLSEEGIGYQEIIGAQDWHLDYVEMSEGSMLEQSLEGYLGSAFDLSKDYKLRACLYDLGGQQYILACVFHHIASDGWSEGILSHEFMELYSSLQAGREAMLAELPLQYADYAIWQRKYLDGPVLEDQLSYWEAKLQGTATLSLPTDHARPSIQGSAGSSVSVFLEKSLSSSLESLCQREGVTLFMLMLSAFKVLLSRYSGQEDICVGTPIANRTQSELEGMIGFFVNTLALRSDLGGNPSFRELLARVKETTLGGYDHQLAPFEKVVDRVVTTREMSTTPLFQVMFDFHNKLEDAKSVELDLQDITITGYDHADTTSQFDLMLSISEGTSDISLAINYSTALFDKPTIERMLGHYEQLLACIAADASQPIGSLSMLSAHEEHQLLDVFNATGVDYPLDRTVVDLFEEQVVKSPDAIAVVFEGEQLSYRELDERSNQLAHYLRGRGVVADTLVGICLERSVEMLVGILGILKSSGAYVPIKPDYPASRISYILEDTRCTLLLTDQLNHEMLMPLSEGISLVVLDGPSPVYSGCLQESLDISHSPDSLGYVIYTSGSTGRPKGALIEHAGLLNHLLVMVDDLNMDNTSVVAFTAPFTFDISVWQLLSGLLCGGRIVVYSEQMILDADDFQNALAAHGVTHLQLVPSYVLSLLETGSRKGLEDLRYFLVTGEAATPSLLRSWFSLFPDVAVVNAYGPAEASDDVSLHVMHEAPSGVVVPIGKPVANMSLYVVDGFDNLCPIGVVGELWVSGIGVGRGYLNQESLTAEKFVNNPFRDGERLYKTGDLARWLPDGNLEYIGRSDAQVKIRGYRIELGEIENALSLMDQVKQCCVVAKHDAVGTKRLVGYVVLEGPLNKESLQDGLRSSLPDYMVPLLWVELDSMPLTSNGKLDRKGLPDPDSSELSSREYVSPGNETEEKLAIIWQDLLGLDQVGIYDNFFELGGHSLLATRLVSMIRRELKTEVSIRDVFEHTTISELGSHISVHSTGVLLPAVVPERRPLRIPLSFSQERLWFLDQLQGSTEYHIPVVLRLQGSLDVSILEQTLQRIVSRHEVLRTLLLSEEGIGYQEIIGAQDWHLDYVEMSEGSMLEQSLEGYLGSAFDLSKDYKLRACLYDLGGQQYILACVFHHIASDGWSEGILSHEFMELYSSLQAGREAMLAELPLQYADYAIWQRKYLDGVVLEDQLSYWEAKLQGTATLSLPTDHARPSIQGSAGSSVSVFLEKSLSSSLESLCQREGVTLFMLMLSAFKVLLSRYSGQEDICVGTPIANRTQSELEGMIGFFVNTLALRSDLGGNPSFRELLARVKETTLGGYDHQLAPFEKVVDRVVTTRDMSTTPLFQVMFVLENTLDISKEEGFDLESFTITDYDQADTTSKFDLILSISESASGISLAINYSTALFEKSTIERMLGHYEQLLAGIVADASQPIGSLSMLSAQEKHQLLDVFNATGVDYPLDRTVVDLFEEQVVKSPDAIAVVFEGEQLSYRELDERSNQLAHYLLNSWNIKTGDLIGVVLDRSDSLIISFLAILKTGSAYIPIDPNYPEERKAHIKKDSNCTIIIDVLFLNSFEEDIFKCNNDLPQVNVKADSLAYVIYTSGSTGMPKGVMVEHKNLVNLCFWHKTAYSVTEKSRSSLFSQIGFDASVWEIYPYLLFGASLYPVSEKFRYDLDTFSKFLNENAISHSYIPTLLCETIIDQEIPLPHTTVLTGGDVLRINKSTNINICNNYGPTETTVVAAYFQLPNSPMTNIPIGKPIHNTQIYILNEYHDLLPVGVIGELCIGGVGVARGYLNQESLTAEKFVNNPFRDGERLYKTGDLARWLPDGNLEYIGRSDAQVKIRGYRIELGEIENALSLMDQVKQCCVVAKHDAVGTKRLVGYVVLEGPLNKESLQDGLRSSLPDYMVPLLWVELDSMPLTSNGKLDRKGLPDPDSSELSSREYVSPRNETEEKLAIIWQDLLGLDQVGIYDNFFELGGHSLLATRLVSMIRRELKTEVSIRDVFEHTTISELGSHISVHSTGVLLPAVVPERRPLRIPLSFSQERLWFLDQLQGSTEYHIPVVLRLQGSLDVSILEQTLQGIVSRHEVLRTLLLSEEGIGYQEIIGAQDWHLDYVEMSECSMLEQSLEGYLGSAFDLSKDYKLRACLYDLGGQQYILACVFHHIASDGWSEGILSHEFMELYSSLQAGREAMLAELPLQYADYAIWQRKYLEGSVLEDQLVYWQEKLKGVTTLALPLDYPRTSVQDNSGANISLTLNNEICSLLRLLCKKEDVTLFMLMLSAFKVLLSRYSGQEDICVGTPIANRTQSELEGMIGFFVNTLALRSDLGGNPSFRELLARVKETTLGGYDHQLAPFEKVVDRVVTTRDRNMTPLFQVLFALQNSSKNSEELGLQDISVSGYEFENVKAQFDLMLSISESDSDISLGINYSTALFDKSTIDRMLMHYQELLISICSDITQPIDSLSILTLEEEKQLLHVFNNTSFDYSQDKTVVDLFREQVIKTPEAAAIVFNEGKMSYKELDERSNQLAHYLNSSGVVGDSRIAILFDRSFDMIVGMLGILKSGCTYVPLDPSLPSNRLSYILNDSNVNFFLYRDESLLSSLSVSEYIFFLNLEESSGYETSEVSSEREQCSIAYVMYTSGTTGVPKGIAINDKNIITLINDPSSKISVTGSDRVLQWSNYAFDGSTYEIFGSLLNGACLYLIDKATASDAGAIAQTIKRYELSIIFVTTALFNSLAEYDLSLLSSLRLLLFGGEKVSVPPVRKMLAALGSDRILHVYGPTETTVYAACHAIYEIADDTDTIPIGKPLTNTRFYVLNSSNSLLPVGVVGELCIGGSGVSSGYLNQDELTKEKFVCNPFVEGDIIYKTGDLVRWLEDGSIDFIGRLDDQVKIRGYRIELGEIETVLSSLPGVVQCCVLAKEDVQGTRRLVGYVVLEDILEKEYLQEQLRLVLPDYMVPALWVAMESMPLTSNGKLDKKSLPEPDSSVLSTKQYVEPRNDVEMRLAAIWQDLLGVEKVGIHDNFFELGGHSLLVIKLVVRINEAFTLDININSIFEYPTISEFIVNMYTAISSKDAIMIPLQETGNQKALYLAPPGSGTINCYVELAKLLGENYPVYAFQSPGLYGKSKISTSIEEMASLFITEMQTIDPYGPYRLGGYSFGGLVAYEMALQLRSKGFDIEELIIFDSSLIDVNSIKLEERDLDQAFRDYLHEEINDMFRKEFNWSNLVLEGKSKQEQLEEVCKLSQNSNFKINEEEIRGRLEVKFNNENYSYLHKPEEKKLDVEVTLFKAMYGLIEKDDETSIIENDMEVDYGWSQFTTKEVIVHLIPATHMSLLDNNHIGQIYECLKAEVKF